MNHHPIKENSYGKEKIIVIEIEIEDIIIMNLYTIKVKK